jgi:hypothetical protein
MTFMVKDESFNGCIKYNKAKEGKTINNKIIVGNTVHIISNKML